MGAEPSSGSTEELVAATEATVRLGSMLLASGSGSFRVEQAMRQAASALGVERLDLLVGVDNILVSARHGERVHTLVRQVYDPHTDASRLEVLEALADGLHPGLTPIALEHRLDEVSSRMRPGWSRAGRVLASGVGCAMFALLNKFTTGDAVVAFLAAMAGAGLHDELEARRANPHGAAALSSLVACVAYGGLGWLADHSGLPVLRSVSGPGFVAALLFLVPGYALVTALLELARADYRAGLPRMTHALGQVLALMLPGWLVAYLTGMRPLVGQTDLPPTVRWVGLFVASWVGMACFSLLFNSTRRVIVTSASLGAVCGLGRGLLVAIGVPTPGASALAALAVGLLTAVLAPRLRVPRSTLMVPASLVMVPGALLARTVYWLGVQDLGAAARNGVQAFGTVLCIAAGLAVARMVTDPQWATMRARVAPHAFLSESGGSHAL